MKLHIIGCNTANQPMHTVRETNGQWQGSFGNVNTVFTANPMIPAIAAIDAECVQYNGKLFVCVLGSNNRLYVSTRNTGGSWTATEDLSQLLVNIPALNAGAVFVRISCTRVQGYLQIFLLTQAGQVVHIGRMNPSGGQSWFRNVLNLGTTLDTSIPIDITAFSYAPGGASRVIIGTATANGNIIRYRYRGNLDMASSQLWLDTVNVDTPIRRVNNVVLPGVRRLSGNISGSDEHFLACLENGQVLHNRAGQANFNNINPVNGNVTFGYIDVGCFDIEGRLHVAAVRNDGVPFHTFRRNSNGNWQGMMGNISTQSIGSGVMRTIALG